VESSTRVEEHVEREQSVRGDEFRSGCKKQEGRWQMKVSVETTQGVVVGASHDGVTSFKGIPYGAPPVGPLRFKPPTSAAPWEERECLEYGAISPQNADTLPEKFPGTVHYLYAPETTQSEDCLNLNIWAPESATSLPVLLWIHGGGFLVGSGTGVWTDGSTFAREHDVIVVSINYRLGALGFLLLDDEGQEGLANLGLLDQIFALEWVRDNITAFGGDPSRVTIIGQSVGAVSVATLIGTPGAQDLFSQAIMESGHDKFSLSMEDAREASQLFLKEMNIAQEGAAESLRSAELCDILDAQARVAALRQLPFRIVVDGDIVPSIVTDSLSSGVVPGVPILIGSNSNENGLDDVMTPVSNRETRTLTDRVASSFRSDFSPDERVAWAGEVIGVYGDLALGDDEIWESLTNDRLYRVPINEFATAIWTAGKAVYSFEFAYPSSAEGWSLGACHQLEVPFAFGNLDQPGVTDLTGDIGSVGSPARELARKMNEAWATFVRVGKPSTPSLPHWFQYSVDSPYQMRFDTTSTMRLDPHIRQLRWWSDHKDLMNRSFGE